MASILSACPLTARVARLLMGGLSIDQVACRLCLHRSSVYRRARAARVPRHWTPVTAAERRQIATLLEADLSRREVAARTGRGLGTVARIARELQGGRDDVHRRCSPHRCPQCGHSVQVWPCLICEARRAKVNRNAHTSAQSRLSGRQSPA